MAYSTSILNTRLLVAPRAPCLRSVHKLVSHPVSIHSHNPLCNRKQAVGCIKAASGRRLIDALDFEKEDISPSEPDEKTLEFAQHLAHVADQIKCEGIRLLDVGKVVDWTDLFLIVSAYSKPQMEAVLVKLSEAGVKWSRQPKDTNPGRSEWEVMDFGDLIVHIMSPRKREFYDLEGLFKEAEEMRLNLGPDSGSPQWANSLKE